MLLTFWSIFATPQGKAGCVAQLDRASDYGSEGLGFESLRGHKEPKKPCNESCGAFSFPSARSLLQGAGKWKSHRAAIAAQGLLVRNLEQEGSLPKAKIPEACFRVRGNGKAIEQR